LIIFVIIRRIKKKLKPYFKAASEEDYFQSGYALLPIILLGKEQS